MHSRRGKHASTFFQCHIQGSNAGGKYLVVIIVIIVIALIVVCFRILPHISAAYLRILPHTSAYRILPHTFRIYPYTSRIRDARILDARILDAHILDARFVL